MSKPQSGLFIYLIEFELIAIIKTACLTMLFHISETLPDI